MSSKLRASESSYQALRKRGGLHVPMTSRADWHPEKAEGTLTISRAGVDRMVAHRDACDSDTFSMIAKKPKSVVRCLKCGAELEA